MPLFGQGSQVKRGKALERLDGRPQEGYIFPKAEDRGLNRDRSIFMRQDKMSGMYSVEGHKSKTTIDDDHTQLFLLADVSPSLDGAVTKARECFGRDSRLGLAVIYKENPTGDRQGLKFIFRDSEGKLEEADLYWGNWACLESG